MNEQLDKMDGVVEAFSVDVLKAKKLVNIGEDVRLHLHYQHNRCCPHGHSHYHQHHQTALGKM